MVYLQAQLQSSGLLDPDRMKCRLPCFCYYAKSCKKRGPCWNLSTSMHGLWNIISERYDSIRHSCVWSLYDIHDNSLFNKMNFSELWMIMNPYIVLKWFRSVTPLILGTKGNSSSFFMCFAEMRIPKRVLVNMVLLLQQINMSL